MVEDLTAFLDASEGIQRKGLMLATLPRLKQICNHPSQFLGDGVYDPAESGKFERLAELAEEIVSRQEKALVFTRFREMTEPLASYLAEIFGRVGLWRQGMDYSGYVLLLPVGRQAEWLNGTVPCPVPPAHRRALDTPHLDNLFPGGVDMSRFRLIPGARGDLNAMAKRDFG